MHCIRIAIISMKDNVYEQVDIWTQFHNQDLPSLLVITADQISYDSLWLFLCLSPIYRSLQYCSSLV